MKKKRGLILKIFILARYVILLSKNVFFSRFTKKKSSLRCKLMNRLFFFYFTRKKCGGIIVKNKINLFIS